MVVLVSTPGTPNLDPPPFDTGRPLSTLNLDPPSAWTHFDSSTREVCRSLHAHAHEPEKFLPGHCAVRTTQLTFCSLSARPTPSVSIRRYGERNAWHRAAEVTKAEHMLFIAEVSRRVEYESMLASPRSQEEASLCSMRPASAACARVAANSTAFRRTCLWKTMAKTRFTRTPRAVRLDISPPRSSHRRRTEPGCSPSEESRFGCVALFEAGASMRADTND